jgi:DNA-binding transcriptional ArsR family regulator
MIELVIDDAAFRDIRFAYSPMWEAISSLRMIARTHERIPWPYSVWAAAVRSRVAGCVKATGLIRWLREQEAPLPRTLIVPPNQSDLTLETELGAIRELDPAAAEGVAAAPDSGAPDPARDWPSWRSWYADSVAAYWEIAIAPIWPAMRAALNEDIVFRALSLVNGGADAVFRGLSPHLRWSQGERLQFLSSTAELTLWCSQSVLAVPMLFGRSLFLHDDGAGSVAFSYPVRKTALLGMRQARGDAEASGSNGLEVLIGRSRAAILRTLSGPTTTTTLATSLRLAPSTVSQHLTALTAAGLISRVRVGGHVYYQLDTRGETLVSCLA